MSALAACDCCEEMPCSASVSVLRRSRTATRAKCGYQQFTSVPSGSAPKIYKKSTYEVTLSDDRTWVTLDGIANLCREDGSFASSATITAEAVVEIDGGQYRSSRTATGTWTYTRTLSLSGPSVFPNNCENGTTTRSGGASAGLGSYPAEAGPSGSCVALEPIYHLTFSGDNFEAVSPEIWLGPGSPAPVVEEDSRVQTFAGANYGGGAGQSSGAITETLEDEFTDGELDTVTAAALEEAALGAESSNGLSPGSAIDPEYPMGGTAPGVGAITLASRVHGVNTRTFTESVYKVRVSSITAAFCRLRARWKVEFAPTGGGAASLLSEEEFIWTRSPNCYPGDGPYEDESEEFTAAVPAAPGIVRITGLRIDCLPAGEE